MRKRKYAKTMRGTRKVKLPTQKYHFPNPGVTIEATSLAEAEKKFHKLVKQNS